MLPYAPWVVWVLPIVGSLGVPVVAALSDKVRNVFAVLIGFITAAFALSMIPDVYQGYVGNLQVIWIPVLNLRAGVLVDSLSVLMVNIAAGIGALILLYSLGYMAHEEGLTRYYFFMLFFIGGMIGLVVADNFLQLYVFWEIVGLCSYALIGFWYKRDKAAKAGMKAFVVTRAGDAALLIGILILFLQTGTFNFLEINQMVEAGKIGFSFLTMILLLIFGGAVGKSAQVPLHVWLPDAMEGPTTVSALIHAATMVKAGIYLVARTGFTLVPFEHIPAVYVQNWYVTVAYVGAVTAFLAATMALVSVDIKRVLAYSTISQLGYIMTALGLGTATGWFAGQFHVLSHALFKALLFLCAGAVMHAVDTTDMRLMGGLRRDMPVTFTTAIIGALALSGIPPLSGFWSKDLIFAAAYAINAYPLLAILVVTAALTFAYSLRWIFLVFLGEKSDHAKTIHVHEAPAVMTIPLVILALLTCVSGFFESSFGHFMGVHGEAGIEAIPLVLSFTALIVGGVPAYVVYYRRAISPEVLRTGSFGKAIFTFISEGYYFDRAYYAVFVNGFYRVCMALLDYVELKIIDGLNYYIAGAAKFVSQGFRPSHTGILSYNMSAILIGLVALVVLLFII